jgi:hypothetical protein
MHSATYDMNRGPQQTGPEAFPQGSEGRWARTQRRPVQYPTTAVERLLLMATIALLPLDDHIPTVAGASIMFIMFGLLAAYVFAFRVRALARTWLHPVFLAAYSLLVFGLLVETLHPASRYRELLSFAFMILGGICVASVCRDPLALRTGLYGYIAGSVWLSLLLFLTTYGALQGAVATNYSEASMVRHEVSEGIGLEGDLNVLAFLTTQGGVVALALTLTARSLFRRLVFLGATLFCAVATFLPMSRGGMIILFCSGMTVLFAYRAQRLRAMVMALILGAGILTWVPAVVFSRMDGLTEGKGRSQVYTAAITNIPNYLVTGVGAGNYYKSWGYSHGFGTVGAHNIFLQLTIFWGLLALLTLLVLIWQVYRCLPKGCGNDALTLCLPGIGVSLLLMMMVSQVFYDKWYSLGLGLFVAVRYWIWPSGVVEPATRQRRHFRSAITPAA